MLVLGDARDPEHLQEAHERMAWATPGGPGMGSVSIA
jgi:hypothetical protein